MSNQTVGTCSLCGGAVVVPEIWMGIYPPTPTCSQCGAIPVQAHGPVIPMRPAPRRLPGAATTFLESCQVRVGERPGCLEHVPVGSGRSLFSAQSSSIMREGFTTETELKSC